METELETELNTADNGWGGLVAIDFLVGRTRRLGVIMMSVQTPLRSRVGRLATVNASGKSPRKGSSALTAPVFFSRTAVRKT